MGRTAKYHRRADGLLETTRTDKRTGKRVHFYGHTDREIDEQIMAYTGAQTRGRLFAEVAKEWSDQHFKTLAQNTLKGYNPAYRRALEAFGDESIRQIKPQDVKRYITEFSRGGRAKKTVTNQLLMLSLIFGYAVESGDIEYSPCDHISVPKNLPKGRRDAASRADEERVKASAHIWLLPYLILYTGIRRGEALALTFGDIDHAASEIHITKSVYHVNNKPFLKNPKTTAGIRSVPILDPLKSAFPENAPSNSNHFIFSDDGGTSPLTEGQYQRYWAQFVEATGISCTAHQLRHSYATMLFELGIDVKDAQDVLGHSTAAMTQDIYTHIRDDRKKKIAATLNERLKATQSDASKATD